MKKIAFLSLAALTLAAATPVLAQGPNFQGNYDAAQATRDAAAKKAFAFERLDAAKVLVVDAEAEVARAQKAYDAKVAEINNLKAQLADAQALIGDNQDGGVTNEEAVAAVEAISAEINVAQNWLDGTLTNNLNIAKERLASAQEDLKNAQAEVAALEAKPETKEEAPKAEDKKETKAEDKKEAKVVKAAKTATASKALPKTSAVK